MPYADSFKLAPIHRIINTTGEDRSRSPPRPSPACRCPYMHIGGQATPTDARHIALTRAREEMARMRVGQWYASEPIVHSLITDTNTTSLASVRSIPRPQSAATNRTRQLPEDREASMGQDIAFRRISLGRRPRSGEATNTGRCGAVLGLFYLVPWRINRGL